MPRTRDWGTHEVQCAVGAGWVRRGSVVSGGDKSVCNGMDEKVQMSILRIVNVAGQGA